MELKISQEKAINAFKNASSEGKTLLSDLFGKQVLCQNPMEWIKTFSDVCKDAIVDESGYAIPASGTNKEMADAFYKRLKLIEKVFNGGWKADLADTAQYKYYPWFNIIPNKMGPSGFALSSYGFDFAYSYSALGARPYFKDSETAIYVGNQFLSEYEAWAQYQNLSE